MAHRRFVSVISVATMQMVDNAAAEMAVEATCQPGDFFRRSVVQRGEAALCQALLQDAIDTLTKPESVEAYCEACCWIRGAEAKIAFEDCCTLLRFQPTAIRTVLWPLLCRCAGDCGFLLADDSANPVTPE